MAEYYSLLERAVAGLQDASPASRRAIYDRARNALLGQLRAMQPPVPEADIERESVALDQAISRLEETLGKQRVRPGPKAPAGIRSPQPTERPPAPGLPVGKAPVVAPPAARERPVLNPRTSAPSAQMSPASPRPSPSNRPPSPSAPVRSENLSTKRPVPARNNGIPVLSDGREGLATDGGSPPPPASVRPPPPGMAKPARTEAAAGPAADGAASSGSPPVLPVAPTLEVPPVNDPAEEPSRQAGAEGNLRRQRAASGAQPRQGQPGARPIAPRPAAVEPRSVGVYVVACVALLLVVGIAAAAWKLRDRPEQVAAARPEVSSPEPPGKIVDRATGDGGNVTADGASVTADKASTPASNPPAAGDAAAVPPSVPQSAEQSSAPAAAQPAPAAVDSGASTPAIPVSQRAALLVDAPEEPQRVKTYVGSVVWRTESVNPGQDQPLSTAVRGDVDIPDAKLTMSMVLKKNLEAQFPASHTMEFHFTELPGNTLGPVKQINVPEMRKDDSSSTGDPLTGVPVSITDDYFLVGLSRGGAEAQNMQMMTDRNWVDLAIIFKSGKVAKITFEKGTAGQQVLEEALKSWR